MLVERLKNFENVCKMAKENGVRINDTEFLSYIAVMNALEGVERDIKLVLSDKELAELIDRVDDIYLEIDEYCRCPLQSIADFCIKWYEDIQDMTNSEVLEDICC